MKLAQADIWGTIAPPTGVPTDAGAFIGGAIRIFLIVAGMALFLYLLWGAFDWITSGGEKEKLEKARNKMTHAVVGIILVIFALALFEVIAGNILKIIEITPGGGWKINLPKFGP
ncbi:hypothetical protein HY612_01830 [Candidatus Roizmanbacteria bacterium]|nr:hypothetical protein [Candidatus Roizmanbacteria bacterium]